MTPGKSSLDLTSETLKREGFAAFYKGALAPLIGQVPYNSLIFTMTDYGAVALDDYTNWSIAVKRGFSGGIAGVFGLVLSTPIEVLKCKQQVNREANFKYSTLVNEIGIKGLFKGFWPLFWRDVPSWMVYFSSYEYLKNKLVD